MTNGVLLLARDRCVTSIPLLVGITLTNLAVAAAYLNIPRQALRLRRKVGGQVTQFGEVKLSAIFVGSCGFAHLLTAVALFWPGLDWAVVIWGSWTAAVSWYTSLVLARGESFYIESILAARRLSERVAS